MAGFVYQPTDTLCEYPGFSRSRACNNQQWAVTVIDDYLLRVGQPRIRQRLAPAQTKTLRYLIEELCNSFRFTTRRVRKRRDHFCESCRDSTFITTQSVYRGPFTPAERRVITSVLNARPLRPRPSVVLLDVLIKETRFEHFAQRFFYLRKVTVSNKFGFDVTALGNHNHLRTRLVVRYSDFC